MSKEKQIQECERKWLIDELSKMPSMVVATAYLHAINYTLYGVDVTEKWLTATQNADVLERAYHEGYCDALQRQEEMRDATEEERRSVKDYIESISKPTGFNFYETQPSEDCVSRETVIEWLKDQDIIKMKWQEENARKELAKLPSVTPKKIYMVCQQCAYHKNPSYEKCKECGALMEVEND